MKKILFLSHDVSRTGAPMVILYFMQWFKKHHPKIEVSILTLQDGGLEEEFKKVSLNYYSLDKIKKKPISYLQKKILSKLGRYTSSKQREDAFLKIIAQQNFDLIYSNTILSIPYGNKLKAFSKSAKHIVHVHELNAIIRLKCPDLKEQSSTIDHFIAASNLVKENLIINWKITNTQITRVYECSKVTSSIMSKKQSPIFTIGGSGTVHWRKGSDLFLQIAVLIKNKYPKEKIKFIWVGVISKTEKIIIEEDIKKADLTQTVEFVGQKENPSKCYNDFDVFLMTSREDPFPLVCIEVGMLGKPIICFKGATGSEEIINKGGGTIVPYLNINAMVEEIISYKNNPEKLKSHGEISRNEFSNFSPDLICPQLFNVIKPLF